MVKEMIDANTLQALHADMNPDPERTANIEEQLGKSRWIDDVTHVPQKSEEWLRHRWNMITASDLGQAMGVGHYGNADKLWRAKIHPPEFLPSPSDGPLDWGNRYEDMSVRCYTQRFGRTVREYGLIPHREIAHFGASPDGITDAGVMLEIKSPFRRKISGEVMEQYAYQIQGQLETCDLDYCDFIECDFEQYRDSDTYLSYLDEGERSDHGAIARIDGRYVYSPEWLTSRECVDWATGQGGADGDPTVFFWRLLTIHVKRIRRDRTFWEGIRPRLLDFWNEVLRGREILKGDPDARVEFGRRVIECDTKIPYIEDKDLEFV